MAPVDRCVVDVETSQGLARAHLDAPARPVGRLLLGHGAGGGVEAADLLAARDAAVAAGWAVARIEQPWRVAGMRVAAAPARLDTAWLEVVAALSADTGDAFAPGSPLVVGGRSAGARVACRTAEHLGAAAVLCLAFPLNPPGRPGRSRSGELPAGVPLLVVQGNRDPFGGPGDVRDVAPPGTEVVAVAGDHSLRTAGDAVRTAVTTLLERLSRG